MKLTQVCVEMDVLGDWGIKCETRGVNSSIASLSSSIMISLVNFVPLFYCFLLASANTT